MRKVRTAGALVVLAAVAALAVATGATARESFQEIATVNLTGAAESPPGPSSGTGKARIFYDMKEGLVCWALTVKGISPAIAAHIHKAPAGTSGPIVVPLSAPTSGGSKGCVGTSRSLIRDILANKSQYYVNVHTKEFPGGAIRAQLG
jgi:hypothetical protein